MNRDDYEKFGGYLLGFAVVAILLCTVMAACNGQEYDRERARATHAETMEILANCKGILDETLATSDKILEVAMSRSNQGVIGEDDAKEFAPVCQIQSGRAGGSGTLVDPHVVLTAAHVVAGNATATAYWPATGERVQGQVYKLDHAHDLAVVLLPRSPSCRPCRIARDVPRPGASITVAGFGGSPRKGFFAAVGRLIGIRGPREIAVSVPVSHGDSGGPLLSPDGELIGVNSTSDLRSYVNGAGSIRRINELVEVCGQAAQQTQCGPGGCGRSSSHSAARPTRPSEWTPAPRQDTVPSAPPTPSPTPTQVNTDDLAKKIVEQMAADPRFRGPPGADGRPGRDGRDGVDAVIDYDRLAAETVKRLPGITFQILESGRVADSRVVPLGGTLQLQLPEQRK